MLELTRSNLCCCDHANTNTQITQEVTVGIFWALWKYGNVMLSDYSLEQMWRLEILIQPQKTCQVKPYHPLAEFQVRNSFALHFWWISRLSQALCKQLWKCLLKWTVSKTIWAMKKSCCAVSPDCPHKTIYPAGNDHISHLGKRKSSTQKYQMIRDTLVPRDPSTKHLLRMVSWNLNTMRKWLDVPIIIWEYDRLPGECYASNMFTT